MRHCKGRTDTMQSGSSLGRRLRRALATLALLASLVLAACGPDTTPTAVVGPGTPQPTPANSDSGPTPGDGLPPAPTETPMQPNSGGTLRWANEGVSELD